MTDAAFTLIDWAFVAMMVALILFVGYRASRSNRSQKDYILGGSDMNPFLVGLSLFATMFSTLSYLSYPGETIQYGPLFCAGLLSFPLAGWVVGKFLIPKFMELRVSSAYEILEIRLGKNTRNLAVAFFLILRFLWMSTLVYATVKAALQPILGISDSMSQLACFGIVLVTVVYTAMGGLKAVVRTDAIQSVIMFIGCIITIVIVLASDGIGDVLSDKSMYAHWLCWDWKPRMNTRMTAANIFIMNCLWQICTAGSDQMAIQRYYAVGDVRKARRTFNISLLSSALIQILLAVVGIMVMAYFTRFPEMMDAGTAIQTNADTLFPRFILVGMPVGLTGLIAAAVMAAAMSSLSSGLNSWATVFQEDILKRTKRGREREYSVGTIRKISIAAGVLVAGASILVGYVQGNLFDVIVKVVNLVVSPLFVLFFMALFIPKSTDWGVVAGGVISLFIAILVAFFSIFGITPLWVMPSSLVAGIVAAYVLSFIDRKICGNN